MTPLSAILAVAIVVFSSFTVAHPGEHHDKLKVTREMEERGSEAEEQINIYRQCQNTADRRAMQDRAHLRRAERLRKLREDRGVTGDAPILHRRDLSQFESWETSHDKTTSYSYNASTPEDTLFGASPKCILTPDNANGPYYVLGESIRSDLVESEVGIPVHLEMQFVDITTCLPATGIFVDVWSCNAHGVYSGVSASGEGGLNTTYLRGVQQPDADGVVVFDTLFPGHYAGRANHEHVIVHSGATLNENGTFSGGHISHLSQLFFDQALINAVEATSPYSTNTIAKTSNNADLFTGYSANAFYDPFPEYILIGGENALSSGLLMWIEIGIRPSADYTSYGTNAAYRDSSGGHDNPNFNMNIVANAPPADMGPTGASGTQPTSTTAVTLPSSSSSGGGSGTGTGAGTVARWGQCGGQGYTEKESGVRETSVNEGIDVSPPNEKSIDTPPRTENISADEKHINLTWRSWIVVLALASGFAAVAGGVGGIVGSLGAGAATNADPAGWRNIFWIQAAFFLATALGIVLFYWPPKKHPDYPTMTWREVIWACDPIGSVLFVTSATLMLLGLDWAGGVYPWSDAHVAANLTIGLVALVAFGVYEWKGRVDGLVAHVFFSGGPNFPLSVFAFAVEGAVNSVVPLIVLNLGFETSAWKISIRQLTFTLASLATSFPVTLYATWMKDLKTPVLITFALFLVATVCYATITPSKNRAQYGYGIIAGIGQSGPLTLLVALIQLTSPHAYLSTATGLAFSARALGGAYGSAILNTIINSYLTAHYSSSVTSTAITAGLPSSSIESLLQALASGAGFNEVPGMRAEILGDVMRTSRDVYAGAYRRAWGSIVPFVILGLVSVAFLKGVKELMTEKVEASVERDVIDSSTPV
ncbi:hypothetical protein B7494_g4740 [Chlorociboria aeruginascens]|nr:hypothetical protein B7494_g4740 [Chlorociboria aeruginascens]